MPYTDSHGRPELIMHPDIVRGLAEPRTVPAPGAEVGADAAPVARTVQRGGRGSRGADDRSRDADRTGGRRS